MKVLACYNIKGGVGKTATAVNLAALAARAGARTLVWDLDPQGAASFYFRVVAKIKGGGIKLLGRKRSLEKWIKATNYELLDLIPADFSYRNLDLMLERGKFAKRRLRKRLKSLDKEYDFIFIDCAPSISLVSENVFAAADALLVPTIPTTLSLRTLGQLCEFLRTEKFDDLDVYPFFSLVDRRKALHRNLVECPPHMNAEFLESWIPYASEVERMGAERAPLMQFAAGSAAADAYRCLWQEVQAKLA